MRPRSFASTAFARVTSLGALLAAFAAAAACGAPTPPPEIPETPVTPPSVEPAASAAPVETSEPEAAPVAKKKDPRPDQPDDYEVTPRDCNELGAQLGRLIHSDEVSKLNPKLNEKQRAQAEASIDKAADTRRDQWIGMCQKSLAGLVQNRDNLRCAMNARTVSAFDTCINGEPTKGEPDDGATAAPSKPPKKK